MYCIDQDLVLHFKKNHLNILLFYHFLQADDFQLNRWCLIIAFVVAVVVCLFVLKKARHYSFFLVQSSAQIILIPEETIVHSRFVIVVLDSSLLKKTFDCFEHASS